MLEIYVARHGQTEWNATHRLQGWLNSDLTANGVKSAQVLGQHIKPMTFDAYYSSPSGRALETMKIATGLDELNINIDERLREIGLGEWQGKQVEEIQTLYPEAFYDYYYRPEVFTLDNAENYYDVKKRVDDFLDDLVEKHYESGKIKRILVITHGITLMIMNLIANAGDIKDLVTYKVADNAKLFAFEHDGQVFSLSLLGEKP